MPGEVDAIFDFEAGFLAGELEFAHAVAHEAFDAEFLGDMGVEGRPIAGFLGNREVGIGQGLHDELIGSDGDGAGRNRQLDRLAGAGLGDHKVVIGGQSGRDFLDLLAELGASGAEVELDLVIERRRGARSKDFNGFDVEVVLENILEAVGGFEADVIGGAENHLGQRLADLEFLCLTGRERKFCERLDCGHLIAQFDVDERLVGDRIFFQMHRLERVFERALRKVLVHRFGEEWENRRDELGEREQAFEEGLERGA